MHSRRIMLVAVAALLFAAAGFAQDFPTDETWEPITVGDTKGYIVPNEVLEELGLPARTLPPEENAATYYLQAIEAFEGPWNALDDRDLCEDFYSAIANPPPERIPDTLLQWFETTAQTRDLIKKAGALNPCQFPLMFYEPKVQSLYGCSYPHQSKMRWFSRLMILEGHVHEINGEPEKAMESYLVIFRIAAHVGQGDSLIAGLVGIACHGLGAGAVERLLATESLNAEELERLQQALKAVAHDLPARTHWIPMECISTKQLVDLAMKDPNEASMVLWFATLESPRVNLPPTFASFMQSRAWRIVFPDRTMKQDFERFFADMAEVCESPPWEAVSQWRQRGAEERIADSSHDWNILAWHMLRTLDPVDGVYVRMRASYAALRLNAGLRRHKAVRGTYPETLDALAPEWIEVLPPDPFSGQPFHYRLDEGKWTLWSVGFDQDDDNGDKTLAWNSREDGDMVWDSAAEEGTK